MDAERLKHAQQYVEATRFRSDMEGYASGLIAELLEDRERLRAAHFAEAARIVVAFREELSALGPRDEILLGGLSALCGAEARLRAAGRAAEQEEC